MTTLAPPPQRTRQDRHDTVLGGSRVIAPALPPVIRREGLRWGTGKDGRSLVLSLTLENPRSVATSPVVLTVARAPFGAFLPGTPVGQLMAPGMAPGERRRITQPLLRQVFEQTPTVQHGSDRSLEDPGRLARQMFKEAYDLAAPHHCVDDEVHLVPHRPANVIVTSPGGEVAVHRHMGFFEHVRPGRANPMPFQVGTYVSAGRVRMERAAYLLSVREISEGWTAELLPGSCGEAVPAGQYVAVVTPPRDAQQGSLIVDVTHLASGEVCPVEWFWGDRHEQR